jgi:phi LC3 family holin
MNLKVRFKNPVFLVQLFLAIFTPILAYAGLTFQDLTSWPAVGQLLWGAIKNPYVLGLIAVSVWNALNDPTTEGLGDSTQAMKYEIPKKKNGVIYKAPKE